MESARITTIGKVRQNNEDFIHADDNLGVYLLADGMGGHNSGEVASELAVKIEKGAGLIFSTSNINSKINATSFSL